MPVQALIRIVIALALFSFSIGAVHAQQVRNFSGNYSLNGQTTGTANYSYYQLANDSVQFHGRFSFTSDVMQLEVNKLRQVMITGFYRRGNKNGEWTYETSDFGIRFKRITGVNVETATDGVINRMTARFKDGLADGRWSLVIQRVKESKKLQSFANANLIFNEGKAVGKFTFSDPSNESFLQVEGHFDEQGYFDQNWKLSYVHEGKSYQENREYVSGFLLRLTLTLADTQEIIYDERFDDVRDKLSRVKENGGTALGLGNRKFGILFNDGYTESDARLLAQQTGNEKLHRVFNYFTDSTGFFLTLPGFKLPTTGSTRRFQYIYPEKEDELIEILRPIVKNMEREYDSIKNSSVLRLNQQKNDTLAFYNALLAFGADKITIITEVLNEIESGKFDYEFRDNFYRHGVTGLHGYDTIVYEYKGKQIHQVIELSDKVNSPDSLVLNLYRYTIGLDAFIARYYDNVSPTILSLQQEDRISRLDETIIKALDSLFITYIGDPRINLKASDDELRKKLQPNDLQLEIFKRYTRDILPRKMQEYVDTQDHSSRVNKGNTILDLIKAVIHVHDDLARIPEFSTELDKVFTRFSANPFFPRDLETRIKTGIYSRGVEILLPYLIDELMKTSTKEDLLNKVDSIIRLEARLREYAESDEQETNRLNSRVRRENQPERIRRLLGV